MGTQSIVDRYRRPEYTGENRCLPCTMTNAIVGIILGNLAFLALYAADLPVWVAGVAWIAVVGGSGVQIWLRGYLVPGTPTLTTRYFPDRVLRWFGKTPSDVAALRTDDAADLESELLEVSALRPAESGEDFELAPAFGAAVDRAAAELDPDDLAGSIREVFDVDGDVAVESTGRATLVRVDGRLLGQWESRPALLADLASGQALADRSTRWDDRSTTERSRLVGGVRLYLETCPACGDTVTFDTETATSCCREYEVATVSCDGCDARLFELPVDAVPDMDA